MLSEAALGAARRHGDRPAVVAPDATITFDALHRKAEVLAGHLAARGIGPGRTVAICTEPGAAWMVAAVAIDRVGALLAGVTPVATASERARLLDRLAPDLAITGTSAPEGLGDIDVAELDAHGTPLDSGAAAVVPEHLRDDRRPFAVCCTSGTTGAPKAALFRVAQARAVEAIDLTDAEGRAMAPEPAPLLSSTQFAHVGFVMKLPWYLRAGHTVFVMRRWRAAEALELVSAQRMATLGVVAPQLALMLRSELLEHLDLSALRLVIAGGAASPPALVHETRRRLGVDYSARWSSTESGGVGLAHLVTSDDDPDVASIGRPRPGVEARVADEDGREVPDGELGELQVRSAAVMDSYLGDPAATDAAIDGEGWLRTGDLARADHRGIFTLAGRADDMYVRGGYNVHPAEVERVLGRCPGVAEVAVVPRADDVMGQLGVAVVVPTAGVTAPTLEELRRHGEGELARHKLPEDVVVLDELPRTTGDKIDRGALARSLDADRGALARSLEADR